MTHLAAPLRRLPLLSLLLAASVAGAVDHELAPLDELPKAPVPIAAPGQGPKRADAAKVEPRMGKGASRWAEVPLPPPPVLPTSPGPAPSPAPAPRAPAAAVVQPPPGVELPSEAEILAAASGEIVDSRAGFLLVEQKCGRCHSMEKALDASIAPDAWDGYLKRKLRRHGTGISEEQAAEIARFLGDWARQRAVSR